MCDGMRFIFATICPGLRYRWMLLKVCHLPLAKISSAVRVWFKKSTEGPECLIAWGVKAKRDRPKKLTAAFILVSYAPKVNPGNKLSVSLVLALYTNCKTLGAKSWMESRKTVSSCVPVLVRSPLVEFPNINPHSLQRPTGLTTSLFLSARISEGLA